LAGGVAHDFNNLLTVILGHSEMLLGAGAGTGPHRPSAEMIRDAAEKAAALTKQLLAFSRKQMLTPVVLNLSDLASDLEPMLRRLIPADIELAMNCDRNVNPVKLDANQMGQVLMNLVANARDAIGNYGKISIATANVDAPMEISCPGMPHGAYVLLRVSDNGCGMDDDVRAHAFEPFYTTKEAGRGTGLGLATVYGIVKQSGGFIYLHSAPGKGTRFDIYFPRVHESLSMLAKRQTHSNVERKTGTILLAEDEDGVRAVTGQVLQSAGYTVLSARDGAEGERIGEQYGGAIDLLVTDLVMPELGGSELALRMKKSRPELKVLFMSGYTNDAATRSDIHHAQTGFLQKPFRPETLLRKVEDVLGAPGEQAAAYKEPLAAAV
jgi:nitrogen-specific signal transduction histidine kinase